MSKKGQAAVAGVFAGGVLVVIAITVFIVSLSLSGQVLTSQQALQAVAPGVSFFANVTNESYTASANSSVKLPNPPNPYVTNDFDNATVVVQNGSFLLVAGKNYTSDPTGQVNITYNSRWTVLNFTYNYTGFAPSTAYNASDYGLSGINNVSGLTPTMGLISGVVILLTILVTVLFMFFKGG